MPVRSPFDGLSIEKELACEFFAVFARLEFALKEKGFVVNGPERAFPDWDRFAESAATWFETTAGSPAAQAVEYLTARPPKVQMADLSFKAVALSGKAPITQAIRGVTRVRNNLFHGGKHTPESERDRDERLVRCSLQLMYACLEQNRELHARQRGCRLAPPTRSTESHPESIERKTLQHSHHRPVSTPGTSAYGSPAGDRISADAVARSVARAVVSRRGSVRLASPSSCCSSTAVSATVALVAAAVRCRCQPPSARTAPVSGRIDHAFA
jgi:hypothetical protein